MAGVGSGQRRGGPISEEKDVIRCQEESKHVYLMMSDYRSVS